MKIVVSDGVPYVRPLPGMALADCDPRQAVRLLREYGQVVYRGFAPRADESREFTGQFGAGAEVPPDGPDPAHPYQPDAVWSLRRGPDRSRTTERLVDGARALSIMDELWVSFARAHGLCFDRLWSRDACRRALRGLSPGAVRRRLDRLPRLGYEFRDDGSLRISYVAPLVGGSPDGTATVSPAALRTALEPGPVAPRLDNGRPVPPGFLEHLRGAAAAACRTVRADAGDLTVLDNHRMVRRSGVRGIVAWQSDNMLGSFPPRVASPLDAAVKQLLESGTGGLAPMARTA